MSSSVLPVPSGEYTVYQDQYIQHGKNIAKSVVPSYGNREGYIPRKPSDFGDGGAFPEIHVAQYPLTMGKPNSRGSGSVLAPTVDENGKVQFDTLVKRSGQTVFSKFSDLVEKDPSKVPMRPSEEEEAAVALETKQAIDKLTGAADPLSKSKQNEPKFIRYTPSNNKVVGSAAPPKQRLIKMVESAVDPLEPPKFRRQKQRGAPPEAPVPLMHSPTRKMTLEQKRNWTIPPCISNWKNSRGYTIPLDKRLAADGRGLKEVTINDKFASISEALYMAEKQAREEVNMKGKLKQELERTRAEAVERELEERAAEALAERAKLMTQGDDVNAGRDGWSDSDGEDRDAEIARENLRKELKRDIDRDLRLEAAGKKTKLSRDSNRDFSERMALGMANPNAVKGGADGAFDSRLFNQSQGIGSGFAKEDEYGVYSKPLFNTDNQKVYRPRNEASKYGTADEQLSELKATHKFKPAKDFQGVDRSVPAQRDGPVQFESGRKSLNALDGRGGSMTASAGGSMSREHLDSSSRSSIRFKRASS